MYLNLNTYKPCSTVEGPGKRFVIWCQGCLQRCEGCCNPTMQDIKPAHIISVEELMTEILKVKDEVGIEGVTFLGGEPMLQAKGLSFLAKQCQENDLTVMVFTGYTREQLDELDIEGAKGLITYADILVDGSFIQAEYDETRQWIGSKNQKIYYLTPAYEPGIEYDKQEIGVEVVVKKDQILINGWPCL